MEIYFSEDYLSDLVLDAGGLFGAFFEYVMLLVTILIAFQLAHFVIAIFNKPPRRVRKRF
jgi:hypothetical protein